MARIPYVDPEQLPNDYKILDEEKHKLHESIDADYWNQAKTVQIFSNNPELARLHVQANVSLWTKSKLTSREVELVILSVARAINSPFEWHAHSIIAIERTGIPRDMVLAISENEIGELDVKIQALIRYVFEYVYQNGKIRDRTHSELAEYYNKDAIVGVAMLSGYYILLDYILTHSVLNTVRNLSVGISKISQKSMRDITSLFI